ncbi:hypothetical protein M408DRAFT_267566 [Serendipita vermifera MAFF 305830]|uniref:Zn(2)-C6 fungal-type domain-containing protein n=1 Tax=Serendipita vermifera MAFF 305830 TaxID=933852 RepID=A0A0C2X0B6_SERVB|nr:hypothetical protein M408DRAFT_267566 [Serendipita vermifera MAFF 305830]
MPGANELPPETGDRVDLDESHGVVTPFETENGTPSNRETFVLACRQCRLRKVKCDSARPLCKNCVRREDSCEYDTAPKRRGPDRQPGTRQRLYKKKPEGIISPRKRNTRPQVTPLVQHGANGLERTTRERNDRFSPLIVNDADTRSSKTPTRPSTSPETPAEYLALNQGAFALDYIPDIVVTDSMGSMEPFSYDKFPASLPIASTYGDISSHPILNYQSKTISQERYIPRGPSCMFYKQDWWNSLLRLYSNDASEGALRIYQDLSFVLNKSVYWLSIVNFSRLMDHLCNPSTRILVQPSVVLSALAIATMMKSSEVGLGEEGRTFALWLRDAAQSSIDASVSASWIEPSLAQAAFFLAVFECALNPAHSESRTRSSIFQLDSFIRALSLTQIDYGEPMVAHFTDSDIPHFDSQDSVLSNDTRDRRSKCTCKKVPIVPRIGVNSQAGSLEYPIGHLELILEKDNYSVTADDEFILEGTAVLNADWPEPDNITEIEKEETRRLCWSSIVLVAIINELTPIKLKVPTVDLFFTRPENLALHFPGEKGRKSNTKRSVWALHSQTALLWTSCKRLLSDPEWRSRRTELASKALATAKSLERALQEHACPEGHGIPFGGHAHLLQIKLFASNQFTLTRPVPNRLGAEVDGVEGWLLHRDRITRHVSKMSQFLVRYGIGIASRSLSKRPLSAWASVHQIKVGIDVWKSNRALTAALEQSLVFLPAADFMSVVWPSDVRHEYYQALRAELIECCQIAGITVPERFQIPGLANLRRKLGLSAQGSYTDIPMAPLD